MSLFLEPLSIYALSFIIVASRGRMIACQQSTTGQRNFAHCAKVSRNTGDAQESQKRA